MEPHSGDHAVSQLCFRTPIAPSHVHLPLLLLPLLADNDRASAGAAHHHHRGKEQPQSKTVGAGDGTP